MQIGQAFYCDDCGVNIYSGTHCTECDPANGSEQVVSTFIVTGVVTGTMIPGGEPSGECGLQLLDEKEQRGFFSRWLGK